MSNTGASLWERYATKTSTALPLPSPISAPWGICGGRKGCSKAFPGNPVAAEPRPTNHERPTTSETSEIERAATEAADKIGHMDSPAPDLAAKRAALELGLGALGRTL